MKTMAIDEAKAYKIEPMAKKALDLLREEPQGSYRIFALTQNKIWRADDDYVLLLEEAEEIEYIKVFA